MTEPIEPRLGAALIFGADAAICVHVHTGPDGIAAIRDRLVELTDQDGAQVTVISVLGVDEVLDGPAADYDEWAIPAADMEDVIAMAKGLNR